MLSHTLGRPLRRIGAQLDVIVQHRARPYQQQQARSTKCAPIHAINESIEFAKRQVDDRRTALVKASVNTTGSLHIIMGPMFAGKSSALLQKVAEAERAEQHVSIITNKKDTRYGVSKCATHDGLSRASVAVYSLMDLVHGKVSGFDMNAVDMIAIDESQFFPDLPEFCAHAVDHCGKTVVAAGLSGDFRQQMFGDLVRMVPYADKVDFLTARCSFCERNAPFTLRLVASDSQELVGGTEAYQPVCRHHYQALHSVEADML